MQQRSASVLILGKLSDMGQVRTTLLWSKACSISAAQQVFRCMGQKTRSVNGTTYFWALSPFSPWLMTNDLDFMRLSAHSLWLVLHSCGWTQSQWQTTCLLLFTKSCCGNAAVNVNSVPPLTWIRRRILSQIFFHHRFSGEPTQIMRRKFVVYLSTDCFHFCRTPVELSVVSASNTKRRPMCAGGLLEADSNVGL
jgi:hypothetical protein